MVANQPTTSSTPRYVPEWAPEPPQCQTASSWNIARKVVSSPVFHSWAACMNLPVISVMALAPEAVDRVLLAREGPELRPPALAVDLDDLRHLRVEAPAVPL